MRVTPGLLAAALTWAAPAALATPDDDDAAEQRGPAKPTDAEELPEGDDQVVADPPLDPARAGEQDPGPYREPEAPERVRALALGADLTLKALPTSDAGVSYLPGLGYGAHARADLMTWLAFRGYFSRNNLPVTTEPGALGLPGSRVAQPNVWLTTLGARLEPGLRPLDRVQLFVGVGVAWNRLVAPIPTTSGQFELVVAERSGVFVEWSASLGAVFDLVPDVIAATITGHGGLLSNVSGSAFDAHAAIDQNGARAAIGGLPIPQATLGASFGLSFVF